MGSKTDKLSDYQDRFDDAAFTVERARLDVALAESRLREIQIPDHTRIAFAVLSYLAAVGIVIPVTLMPRS